MRGSGPESLKFTAYEILPFHVNTVHSLIFQLHSKRDIACCHGWEDGKEKEKCRRRG